MQGETRDDPFTRRGERVCLFTGSEGDLESALCLMPWLGFWRMILSCLSDWDHQHNFWPRDLRAFFPSPLLGRLENVVTNFGVLFSDKARRGTEQFPTSIKFVGRFSIYSRQGYYPNGLGRPACGFTFVDSTLVHQLKCFRKPHSTTEELLEVFLGPEA